MKPGNPLHTRIRAQIAVDMLTHKQRADATLLANLRNRGIRLPVETTPHAAPEQSALWWPLWNPWAMAIDDALREAGLSATNQDSDPVACLEALIANRVRNAVDRVRSRELTA